MSSRAARWAILLVVLASLRIVSTYRSLSHTTDEPAHLAAGMQYIQTGRYTYEDQHPPLARVMGAAGLWLAGARYEGDSDMYREGWHLLGYGNRYRHNLFFARLAMLPLFWLACAVVWRWARRLADERSALFAVAVFTLTPVVLGHAGLATTDFALTALVGAAMLASLELRDTPDARRAATLGLLVGLAVLSKFSALAFLPLGLRWSRASLKRLPIVLGVAAVLVCATYSFSVEPFFTGIRRVWEHNREGHLSFLLGQVSPTGFWYYYPVVLLLKTPLALFIMSGFSRQWALLATAGAMMAVSMSSHINIGIRHILPIFIPLAICAGLGAARLSRPLALALCAWLAISGALAHPDYISYTNELAGRHPENILADSDLDWEQGVGRLNQRLHELNAGKVHLRLNSPGYLYGNSFVPFDFIEDSETPPHGWSAVAVTPLRITGQPRWAVHAVPKERIAHSILLYWNP